MTTEEALAALWLVASNATLVATKSSATQGLTLDDHIVLTQAYNILLEAIHAKRPENP